MKNPTLVTVRLRAAFGLALLLLSVPVTTLYARPLHPVSTATVSFVAIPATPPDSALQAALAALSPASRKIAELYVGDTSVEKRAAVIQQLSSLAATDSAVLDFLSAVAYTDPTPAIREASISAISAADVPQRRVRESLTKIVTAAADRQTVERAVRALESPIGGRETYQALAARIAANGGTAAPRWMLRAHQQLYDQANQLVLPWFMREPPPVFAAAPATARAIRFFAIGDWGENDNPNENAVSATIRARHRRTPFTFGMTLGDNFYGAGLESPAHPRWQTEYERQYGVMNIPIYATLGNHDYYTITSPAAEISYAGRSKTWKLPATNYTFTAGPVQFFIIDTQSLTPFQLAWLDSTLAASTAKWKIVCGHYDIYSARTHPSGELQMVVDLLKRHRVTMYLNGHYHTMQHYQADGIEYVTSGGGGAALYGIDGAQEGRKFAAQSHGFATFNVTQSALAFEFVDLNGKVLYTYTRRE